MAKLLNTTINGFLSSLNFVSGALGSGWRIFKRLGKWVFETDDIVVRGTMTVFELLISKIRAIKGALGITQASGKIKSTREDEENYYLKIEDEMSFCENDIIKMQEFSGGQRNYWVIISGINGKELIIPKSEFEGSSTPQIGDEVVQFGNITDKKRQSAIYLHADENGQPAIDILFGIHSKTFDGCTKIRIGGDIPGTNGLKGFYCENGMLKGLNEAGELMYCLYPDGTAYLGVGAAIFRPDKSGHIAGGAISWQWDATRNKYVCTMGDVILTWDNLSDEVREKLKGNPGQDANLLPWVEDWTTHVVEIGANYLISPKIFTGTNTGTVDKPVLTGVALGRDVITVDGIKKTGLFGLKEGKLTFSVDVETGDAAFSGILDIGDGANVIRPDKTGHLANKNIIWDAKGNATFKGIIYASGGYFTGKIQSSDEGKRFIIDPSGDPSFKMISRRNKTLASMSFAQAVPDVADTEMTTFKIYNYITDFPVGILTTTLSAFGLSISDGIDDSIMGNQNNVVLISKGAIIFKNLQRVESTTDYSRVLINTKTGELAYG